jgi:signal transduction histidine kinase
MPLFSFIKKMVTMVGAYIKNKLKIIFFKNINIEGSNKVYYLICLLILSTYSSLMLYATLSINMISTSARLKLFTAALCVIYLLYHLLRKNKKAIKILRSPILIFCLPFLTFCTLLMSGFHDQYCIRFILSLGLLYIFTTPKSFLIFNVLVFGIANILFIFVSNIEHDAIFINAAYSTALFFIIFLKIRDVYNKIAVSNAFANAIAHEVYRPISIVKLKTELLLDKANSNEKFDLKNELTKLTQITNNCLKDIDNILVASKNINAEYSDTKRYSVVKCIETALDEFNFTEYENNSIDFNKSADFKFKGSDQLLKHVIFNLLKNTLSHAGKDANIYIWVKNKKLHFKDTGIGIKKHEVAKVFDIEFTKSSFGIGLHLCKKIMQKLGGGIKCRSEYKKYTEFILTFDS